MKITTKQSIELLLTHSALIQIRNLAAKLVAEEVSQEDRVTAVKRIHALADAFHEVPGVISSGDDLDVKTFRGVMKEIGFHVPEDYPDVVENIPQIKGRAIRFTDGSWSIRVKCPYCSESHKHGGGSGDKPDGGHRQSHCLVGTDDSAVGYTIAEIET